MKKRFGSYSQRIYNTLVIVGALLFALICCVVYSIIRTPETVYIVQEQIEDDITKTVQSSFVTGIDTNEEIEYLIARGYGDIVYQWYDKITGNRRITITILHSALLHGIPVNLSFAQAWQESRFTYNAIGYNRNQEGNITSRDFGLKQLNEYSFQYCSYRDMMDIEYNIAIADAYLISLYKKYNQKDAINGWDRALMAYNRGNRIDEQGMRYVQSIRNYEKYLDKRYNLDFPKFFKEKHNDRGD